MSFGSESSGGIHNVTVRNVLMQATDAGFYIKSGRGRGGVVSNLTFENITVQSALVGILVSMYYTKEAPSTNMTTTPQLRDVVWNNVSGTTLLAAGQFCCLPESDCTQMRLQDVVFSSPLSGYTNCQHARGSADTATSPSPAACLAPSPAAAVYPHTLTLDKWDAAAAARGLGVTLSNPLCPTP